MADQVEAGGEKEYKPPMSQMQNAMLIIAFIGYCLLGYVWGGHGWYNTFFAWGGWLWLVLLFVLLYGGKVIENRSPKFSSNVVGTTIASPQPIITEEPQGGWPRMGLFALRTVRGLGIYEYSMTCRAYCWMPTDLAYTIGQEEKGVNVVANCYLRRLTEHSELPPHLLDSMKLMRRPVYNPDMPVYIGYFPLLVNELTAEQIEECKKEFEAIGISRELFEPQIKGILERYAAKLSRFRYSEKFQKPEEMLQSQIRSLNTLNDSLKKANKHYRTEMSAIFDLTKFSKELPSRPDWRERISSYGPGEREQEREEQENRGR
jgi:hypothetical protein